MTVKLSADRMRDMLGHSLRLNGELVLLGTLDRIEEELDKKKKAELQWDLIGRVITWSPSPTVGTEEEREALFNLAALAIRTRAAVLMREFPIKYGIVIENLPPLSEKEEAAGGGAR